MKRRDFIKTLGILSGGALVVGKEKAASAALTPETSADVPPTGISLFTVELNGHKLGVMNYDLSFRRHAVDWPGVVNSLELGQRTPSFSAYGWTLEITTLEPVPPPVIDSIKEKRIVFRIPEEGATFKGKGAIAVSKNENLSAFSGSSLYRLMIEGSSPLQYVT